MSNVFGTKPNAKLVLPLAVSAALISTGPAVAQTLEEVIVVATKREQGVMDVPLASGTSMTPCSRLVATTMTSSSVCATAGPVLISAADTARGSTSLALGFVPKTFDIVVSSGGAEQYSLRDCSILVVCSVIEKSGTQYS